jgi:SPP1 gp7 family putative phage head morphogenesis protein
MPSALARLAERWFGAGSRPAPVEAPVARRLRSEGSLTWLITTDVGRFSEALDAFASRVVMTRDDALALDLESRRRAFWIAGGLQLGAIQSVFNEIATALESGEDYAAFKKRISVAIKPAHLETVFRNATQHAYNAGRWQQMQEAKAFRPFVMFDAVMDSRSSDICGDKIDGKIVSIDDPFLRTNSPQRHHRCRTGLRSLRRADAERRGITPRDELDAFPPAAKGFGHIPTDAPLWKPDPDKHDPALRQELDAKESKPRTPNRKAKREHDPAHWEKHYRQATDYAVAGYGEAAPAVAWGRAMLERGLDRPTSEVVAELRRLNTAGFPGLDASAIRYLERLPQDQPLRAKALAHRFRGLVALSEHTRTIKTGDFPMLTSTPALREARRFYQLALDRSVRRPSEWTVALHDAPDFRAYASGATKGVHLATNDPARIAVHEFAHALEFTDTKTLNRSIDFLTARTRGEQAKPLRDLTGNTGYGADELARKDQFFEAYVGKDYQRHATEVTSMGYEEIARSGGLERLATKDPEMLFFLLGQLGGR